MPLFAIIFSIFPLANLGLPIEFVVLLTRIPRAPSLSGTCPSLLWKAGAGAVDPRTKEGSNGE